MISIIMYPSATQNLSSAEAQELPFANAIDDYWQPIQTWSPIALSISQNGLALSAGAATILVLFVFYAVYVNRKEKLGLFLTESRKFIGLLSTKFIAKNMMLTRLLCSTGKV